MGSQISKGPYIGFLSIISILVLMDKHNVHFMIMDSLAVASWVTFAKSFPRHGKGEP